MLTNADRKTRGVNGAHKHSSLDELTFNRDFDMSHSTGAHAAQLEAWKFEPSYSGFASIKLRKPAHSRSPVTMMDNTISTAASFPQVVDSVDAFRSQMQIKNNPMARAYVTDKLTSLPHEPAQLQRAPMRTCEHKFVFDQDGSLLINMNSSSPFRSSPTAPLFYHPKGSVPPATHFPGRPMSTHEPGRHRFFLGDVRAKI